MCHMGAVSFQVSSPKSLGVAHRSDLSSHAIAPILSIFDIHVSKDKALLVWMSSLSAPKWWTAPQPPCDQRLLF